MIIILVALSLSMDAFSLAVIYGILNFSKKDELIISIVVGMYHLIMPIIGSIIGNIIISFIPIKLNILVSFIFIIIGIEMLLDVLKNEEPKLKLGIIEILIFGFAVSIDSFGTGLGLKYLTNYIFNAAFIFSFTSFIITYIGLKFGKKIGLKVGKLANIIGGIILLILGLLYMFK